LINNLAALVNIPHNNIVADDVMYMVCHAKPSDSRQLALKQFLHNLHGQTQMYEQHAITHRKRIIYSMLINHLYKPLKMQTYQYEKCFLA